MAAKLIFTCPNDGEFLIQFVTFHDGRPGFSTRGKGETWHEQRLGYVGTADERREHAESRMPIGRYADAEPTAGDPDHWRYVIECPNGCKPIRLNDETIEEVIYPILRGLHAHGARKAHPVVIADRDMHTFIRDERQRLGRS